MYQKKEETAEPTNTSDNKEEPNGKAEPEKKSDKAKVEEGEVVN